MTNVLLTTLIFRKVELNIVVLTRDPLNMVTFRKVTFTKVEFTNSLTREMV